MAGLIGGGSVSVNGGVGSRCDVAVVWRAGHDLDRWLWAERRELRERTLSVLNTEADRWDGGKDFATSATDAYGRSVSASIEKGILNYRWRCGPTAQTGFPEH